MAVILITICSKRFHRFVWWLLNSPIIRAGERYLHFWCSCRLVFGRHHCSLRDFGKKIRLLNGWASLGLSGF